MKNTDKHLTEDQLIVAVVDENDLDDEAWRHLNACGKCLEKKNECERELAVLGRMAEEYAPSAGTVWHVRSKPAVFGAWRPAFAAAFTVLVLTAGIVWLKPFDHQTVENGNQKNNTAVLETADDEQLLAEIQELENRAMVDFYSNIFGESSGYYDEEFIDFVVPFEDDQTADEIGFLRENSTIV